MLLHVGVPAHLHVDELVDPLALLGKLFIFCGGVVPRMVCSSQTHCFQSPSCTDGPSHPCHPVHCVGVFGLRWCVVPVVAMPS